jgi:hypothetical protein
LPETATSIGARAGQLDTFVPPEALALVHSQGQKAIPALAKDPGMIRQIELAVQDIPTHHELALDDSRLMEDILDESVHLVPVPDRFVRT